MSCLLHLDLSNDEFETFLWEYGGNVCQKCFQLALVSLFPAWPDQHHTDISSALEVLKGELREDVADRVRCSRPTAQWPSLPSAENCPWHWWGLWRGLVGVVDSSILPDVCGPGVMNGAVGVQKLKTFRGRQCADPSARHFALGTQ